jgi:hypothetical protein
MSNWDKLRKALMKTGVSKIYNLKKSPSNGESELRDMIYEAGSDKWMLEKLKNEVRSLKGDVASLEFELDTCRTAKKAYKNMFTDIFEQEKVIAALYDDIDTSKNSKKTEKLAKLVSELQQYIGVLKNMEDIAKKLDTE